MLHIYSLCSMQIKHLFATEGWRGAGKITILITANQWLSNLLIGHMIQNFHYSFLLISTTYIY